MSDSLEGVDNTHDGRPRQLAGPSAACEHNSAASSSRNCSSTRKRNASRASASASHSDHAQCADSHCASSSSDAEATNVMPDDTCSATSSDADLSASNTPGSPPPPPSSELERKVRAIQKGDGSAAEKTSRIRALFVAQQELAASVSRRTGAAAGTFPGAGASAGCAHYSRRCWIRAECCGRYYPCRRCHDEAEGHEIDRRATRVVACVACGDDQQPVAESCRTCGVRFARYFCSPCRLYNDAPDTQAYHCDECGICRVGRAEDNYHCERCATCVPIQARDVHPCRERNLDNNCPICGDHLATSTAQTIFLKCSHPIHVACLEQYMTRHFVCPVCSKCIHDRATMDKWYRHLDERIMQERMPEEYANRVSRILCNDCETKCLARFHFRFHRCADCYGYNTRVLHHFDVDPSELPPPITLLVPEAADAPPAPAQQPDPPPLASYAPPPDSIEDSINLQRTELDEGGRE